MIALTDRFKRDDHFWFSVFHEIGHVFLHGKRLTFLDEDPAKASAEPAEEEASRFAADVLIPPRLAAEYRRLRNHPRPFSKIVEFAALADIPSGVVVGRLQHDGALDWG